MVKSLKRPRLYTSLNNQWAIEAEKFTFPLCSGNLDPSGLRKLLNPPFRSCVLRTQSATRLAFSMYAPSFMPQ